MIGSLFPFVRNIPGDYLAYIETKKIGRVRDLAEIKKKC